MPKKRICIVSPSHLSNNPRVVKEADALAEAGYDITVVHGRTFPPIDHFDREIEVSSKWKAIPVSLLGLRSRYLKVRQHMALRRFEKAAPQAVPLRTALLANNPNSLRLARAAGAIQADLYLGHMPAGLGAAALAAARRRAPYGFDAEDYHPAETDFIVEDTARAAALRRIESELISRAAFVTAASSLIGSAYAAAYPGIPEPRTVLNVFPRSHAPLHPPGPAEAPTRDKPALLYWFSQTVGPSRGLEALVSVLAKVDVPVGLHLRGLAAPGYEHRLRSEANARGFSGPIEFLPLASAAEMAVLAQGYAMGLSLEEGVPQNRNYCLTNKIFTYLLAGLPVGLSQTAAQEALLPELKSAGHPLDLSQPESAARTLSAFLGDPSLRTAAQECAWRLGQERFNWDVEKTVVLESVDSALNRI